jgi:hypothetical protein
LCRWFDSILTPQILRDVEDGYPLGLISLDRRFESGSRN